MELHQMQKMGRTGFSLVELLITLTLLGILAAFTIPSMFMGSTSGRDAKFTALSRDAAFMVLAAYEQYKAANATINVGTKLSAFTPYMSYVKIDTSTSSKVDGPLEGKWATGSQTCGAQYVGTHYCYRLHNGGVIWFDDAFSFGGTGTTDATWFNFDPDAEGSAEALQIWITYDGKIYTVKTLPTTMRTGYIFSTETQAPATQDASWFTGF